ncbi:MAG: IclR family transcriptional regulator [Candidatus Methylomirabilis oxyfera]|nr:IclR family transcriptional regulator [Candidatus Methylomirabilis oxyfera]
MEHRKKEKADYVVQSVDRALDILESFDFNEEELGVSELAHKLDLHKNNVFRLLATLEVRGYIEQDKKSGNYRLGIKTFEIANVFLHHLGLRRQARPILEELVGRCDETGYLAVLDGSDVIYVLMHETTQTVRIMLRLGQRLPAHCTAAGKAQLAFESVDRLQLLFKDKPLRKLTDNTITSPDALRGHLREVARLGFATDNEEFELGVRCLAAPVKDYSKKVVASVGLSGPLSRFSMDRIEKELAPLVKEAGEKISERLGYEISVVTS